MANTEETTYIAEVVKFMWQDSQSTVNLVDCLVNLNLRFARSLFTLALNFVVSSILYPSS